MNNLTAGMVRGLKGAPASIMFLLMSVRQTVSNGWLVAYSGYTDKPIATALLYLKEQGLIVHSRGGWRLAGPEHQLPFVLPAPGDFAPEPEPEVTLEMLDARIGHGPLVPMSTSRNNSDSLTESGGGSGLSIKDTYIQTTTTTTESELFRLTNIRELSQALIFLGGIGPDKAEAAIERALERGETPEAIKKRILACADYISNEIVQGRHSIHYPGSWAAGLVAAGYDPAAPAGKTEPDADLSRYDGYLNNSVDKLWISGGGPVDNLGGLQLGKETS